MKALLTAIKTQLQTDLSNVRDSDIFITEDEHLIPEAVRFPAVALKDDGVKNELDTTSSIDQQLAVRISVYSQIMNPEESIMGTEGVLQVEQDIVDSLQENNLSLAGVSDAFPASQEASETFGDEEEMIQKKTVVFRYKRYKAR